MVSEKTHAELSSRALNRIAIAVLLFCLARMWIQAMWMPFWIDEILNWIKVSFSSLTIASITTFAEWVYLLPIRFAGTHNEQDVGHWIRVVQVAMVSGVVAYWCWIRHRDGQGLWPIAGVLSALWVAEFASVGRPLVWAVIGFCIVLWAKSKRWKAIGMLLCIVHPSIGIASVIWTFSFGLWRLFLPFGVINLLNMLPTAAILQLEGSERQTLSDMGDIATATHMISPGIRELITQPPLLASLLTGVVILAFVFVKKRKSSDQLPLTIGHWHRLPPMVVFAVLEVAFLLLSHQIQIPVYGRYYVPLWIVLWYWLDNQKSDLRLVVIASTIVLSLLLQVIAMPKLGQFWEQIYLDDEQQAMFEQHALRPYCDLVLVADNAVELFLLVQTAYQVKLQQECTLHLQRRWFYIFENLRYPGTYHWLSPTSELASLPQLVWQEERFVIRLP